MIRKKKEKRKIFFVPIHFLAMLKFIYSEEATKSCEIFTLLLFPFPRFHTIHSALYLQNESFITHDSMVCKTTPIWSSGPTSRFNFKTLRAEILQIFEVVDWKINDFSDLVPGNDVVTIRSFHD